MALSKLVSDYAKMLGDLPRRSSAKRALQVFLYSMKKLVIIIAILLGTLGGVLAPKNAFFQSITRSYVSYTKENHAPTHVTIPTVGIDVDVDPVGKDSAGRMANPEIEEHVGWYKYGPYPGQKGSVVLAGHYDSLTGPSIFYHLGDVAPGDLVTVTSKDGKTLTYKVRTISIYPDNEFPIAEVFAKSDGKHLNLITCEGIFNKATKNYSHRTVVYTDLVE